MIKQCKKTIQKDNLYDYSDAARREQTAAFLLDYAARSKDDINAYWNKMRAYYDGNHEINSQTGAFYADNGLPWRAAQSTDGYIHVETQIEPEIPDFEFVPRSGDDAQKARMRRSIAKYIVDNNDLVYKNSRNERRLGIYGSAVWKVCWDSAMDSAFNGDVCIEAPSPSQIYTDPTAADVDGCEYIGYVYKMHKQKAKRLFENDLKYQRTSFDDICSNDTCDDIMTGSVDSEHYMGEDDTVTVTEWWYRQPKRGKCTKNVYSGGKMREVEYTWQSGDIALSVFINGHEVRNIPKYWLSTSNKSFPFVIYNRIPNENSLWGKSELELIIPLIDAKDRELCFAQLNNAFSSNDIILAEENAFSDGEYPENSPGAMWKLRPGMMGKVQRLGNTAAYSNALYSGSNYFQSLIENTTGNFEVNQGKEPTNVTTATGIALLNERAQTRKSLKNIDRSQGFKRLFSLIDATALEYYNDGREIMLADGKSAFFKYSDFAGFDNYIPVVDVVIHTGNTAANSKALTISALATLMGMNITKDNYVLAKAYIDAINIPERGEISDFLEKHFGENTDNDFYAEVM